MDLSGAGGAGRALAGLGGELLLWPAEPADAGVYSCRVTAPGGQYAQKDVQIFVRSKYLYCNILMELFLKYSKGTSKK